MSNADIRTKALEWWNVQLSISERMNLLHKYKVPCVNNFLAEEILPIYQKEHGIQDEAEKDTLEKAAERWIIGEGGETQRMFGHHYRSFRAGTEWQKEQDKAIIQEFLDAMKSVRSLNLHKYEEGTVGKRVHHQITSAITKAEEFLKQ